MDDTINVKNTSNSSKNTTSECKKNNNTSSTASQQNLGLASISYADYVILSATLSYAISEELNDADLAMIIVFFGMITSDLALLRTKRGIATALGQGTEEGAILGAETATEDVESTVFVSPSSTLRSENRKKSKRIKKVKKKKRKSNNSELAKNKKNKNSEN